MFSNTVLLVKWHFDSRLSNFCPFNSFNMKLKNYLWILHNPQSRYYEDLQFNGRQQLTQVLSSSRTTKTPPWCQANPCNSTAPHKRSSQNLITPVSLSDGTIWGKPTLFFQTLLWSHSQFWTELLSTSSVLSVQPYVGEWRFIPFLIYSSIHLSNLSI